MGSERISVTAVGRPRWRAVGLPSGAEQLVHKTRAQRGDRERRWLTEVKIDLRDGTLDPEYWLSNCHGFLVDSESGRDMGVVEDVELERSSGRALALVVASGWFGRRVQTVPVAHVQTIFPRERRLVVMDPAGPPDVPPERV
jgi:sporulation protein YlmC with PRC-barrel domain